MQDFSFFFFQGNIVIGAYVRVSDHELFVRGCVFWLSDYIPSPPTQIQLEKATKKKKKIEEYPTSEGVFFFCLFLMSVFR